MVTCDKAASSTRSRIVLFFILSFPIFVDIENWVLTGSSSWFVRLEKGPAILQWTEEK